MLNKAKDMNFFKKFLKNIGKSILKFLGMVSKSELKRIEDTYQKCIADLRREIASGSFKLERSKDKVDPHDFDELLPKLHPEQINALVYRIINDARNSKEDFHYLDRWRQRIENAQENPPQKFVKVKEEK